MNSNQLFPGEHYAYVAYPRRKPGTLYVNASRVRIIRTLSVEAPGYQKRLTMVEVEFLDKDGNPRNPETYRTIRARQIVYRWSEHAQMLAKYEQKESEYQRKRAAERAEWQKRENERLERVRIEEEARRERLRQLHEPIYSLFERVGIDRKWVVINYNRIEINKQVVEEVANEQSVVQN